MNIYLRYLRSLKEHVASTDPANKKAFDHMMWFVLRGQGRVSEGPVSPYRLGHHAGVPEGSMVGRSWAKIERRQRLQQAIIEMLDEEIKRTLQGASEITYW